MIPINRYTLGAAALVAVLLAFWGWGRYQYHRGVSDTTHVAELTVAAQQAADNARMDATTTTLQKQIEALQNVQPKIITKYRDIIKRVPLPGTCRIDADRLHSVQSAIHAANAAR